MDRALLSQLRELVKACHNKGIKPIICGGLGVYLSFFKKQSEISNMIRATQDIDLMLSRQDILEEAKRRVFADILTKDLKYIVCGNKRHHGFVKDENRQLDILAASNFYPELNRKEKESKLTDAAGRLARWFNI